MMKDKRDLIPRDPSKGRKSKKMPLKLVTRQLKKQLGRKTPKKKPKMPKYKDVTFVHIDKIYINFERQRWPEPAEIDDQCDKWDTECASPLQCRWSRGEDRYYVCDGMQHGITWVIQYGEDTYLPVFAIESDDEELETKILLCINTQQKKMSKYHIHKQKIMLRDRERIAIEKAVTDAGVETGYRTSAMGVITHMGDLDKACETYGLKWVTYVLSRYRNYWPRDHIHTATLLGLLKVGELITETNKDIPENVFDDILSNMVDHFDDSNRLHHDIKNVFKSSMITIQGGSITTDEKIASGILDVYSKLTGIQVADAPCEIDMPVMDPKFVARGLSPAYNKKTYHTPALYRRVCETGDLSIVWAYLNATEYGVDVDEFHKLCGAKCACGSELDYGRGDNNSGCKDPENTPSVDHKLPRSKGGKDIISNFEITCNACNSIKSNATKGDEHRFDIAKKRLQIA